ncbi:SusC/RagA family TonB-linked outer membrane protein [Chitinophaga sp. 30R24]|uniref:SusC/RagA family TonB-linked outer membrane protein n=1 Tax=Chitinophaga sp. 30R24 TaxID=3248838 RepID=UPI003B917183
MKRGLLLGLFMAMSALHAFAQTRTITGKVTDAKDGSLLPGVSVIIKGSLKGSLTNASGTYTLNVPSEATLVFTFIGYAPKEVKIGDENTINVALGKDNKQLNEVIVTALCITRSQKSLGYEVSTLKGSEIVKARETNMVNALAGKIAGVRVNNQSGTLGGSAKIIIRGANSINGDNQPIFVVDGMPIYNNATAGGTTGDGVDYGNRAGDINSDDVEDISVLKGPAATALYGARAKNGAVIITTKRGKMSSPVSVTVNSSVRFDNILRFPDLQNEYAQGSLGQYNTKSLNGWGPKMSDVTDVKVKDFMGDDVTLQAYPDNVKDFFQTGVSYINNVAVSGGSDKSDYRLSLTSTNQTGAIPQSSLNKYVVSLNTGHQINKILSSRVAVSYSKTKVDGRPSQSSNNPNILTGAIFSLPRNADINKLRNHFEDPITGEQIFLSSDKSVGNNPFWIMNYNRNSNDIDRITGNVVMDLKPLPWLTISDNAGGDIYTEKRLGIIRKGSTFTGGSFTTADLFYRQINNDFMISAQKTFFQDLGVKLLAGHNVNDRLYRGTSVTAQNLTIDKLYSYDNAATKTPSNAFTQQRLVGVYGDLSLSYKDYLFLDVTGRNDWSSTLPVNNHSYFYPSVSSSFLFSEFTKEWSWLTSGKVRASWASVGSDERPYQLDFAYTPATSIFVQFFPSQPTVFPFGPISTAFTGPRTLPLANLKPQKINTFELGTDLSFLKNRIGLNFTYYNTVTKQQIVAITVPTSTGYFANNTNIGRVRNKGLEAALNLVPLKSRNFTWSMNVNFAKNKQVVEELYPGLDLYNMSSGWSNLSVSAHKGETFGLYGKGWQRDKDGNVIIDPKNGLRLAGDVTRLGDIYPDWTMGINNNFNYKGFSLSFLIDIRQGGVMYSGTVASLRGSGLAAETGANRENRFIDKGVNVDGSGKSTPNATPVQSMQDFWSNYAAVGNTEGNVFDASFAKLREVRLGYALPAKLLGNQKVIKGLELGLEARNVWLIKSHVPHIDPELNFFGANSSVVGEGVEFNSVPSTRSWGINLRASF